VFIAGGIGITPLRALFEAIPAQPGDLSLLYRASRESDLLFRSELERLADVRGADVHYLVGRRDKRSNPLSPGYLRKHVPDIANRDVYLCGPSGMMDKAAKSLRSLGVRRSQIHRERFEL
jgi:ferredoxin-NADP reductase